MGFTSKVHRTTSGGNVASVSPRIRKHCPCPPNGLQGMFSVRSCALVFLTHPAASPSRVKTSDGLHGAWILIELSRIGEVPYPRSASCLARSEERRVGKES